MEASDLYPVESVFTARLYKHTLTMQIMDIYCNSELFTSTKLLKR